MAQHLIPQIDVGAVSANGVSAVNSLLTAVSADDVAPTALIQLSELGSHFHISGPYAKDIPNFLQRTSSTRLDRLGLLVGWKRGDAASYIANTAGGQAIALVCLCIHSICGKKTGGVLYDVSARILSLDQSVSSVKQIGDVAKLLFEKLAVIGYGNILAREALKITSLYEHLSKPVPTDLYDLLTREGLVEFLCALSRAFDEENCQVRITGTRATAWLMAILMISFPDSLTVSIEGQLTHKGSKQLILLEIISQKSAYSSTSISIEYKLQ